MAEREKSQNKILTNNYGNESKGSREAAEV
jgi:hypothetical protein